MAIRTEGPNQRSIWLHVGQKFLSRLFRVNTGKAWFSGQGPKGCVRMGDGSMMIYAPRPVALGFGLPNGDPLNGTSDLNGWTPVTITPAMVGQVVAVYTAIETKRPKGGRTSGDQHNFVAQVQQSGGIAGVASSPEEAEVIVQDWYRRFQEKLL